VVSTIELDSSVLNPECVQSLSDFSHLIVVFYLHKIPDEQVLRSASHPRGNPNWPRVGIFAQRKKNRLNKIGVSICELLEVKGLTLKVRALDAIATALQFSTSSRTSKSSSQIPTKSASPSWVTQLVADSYSESRDSNRPNL
jgi:hypothetical protein